ncbi:DUF4286 family protein [Limibacter armeniacum]|uniref:DUF4286 family protein n=1 Tax=Limibacter armeniacum TaxID=466084 RepID=UPI002FE59A4C
MIIYNVTINVEKDVMDSWKKWMTDVHIPEVMATGYFQEHKFLRLLDEVPGNTGETFAVQYIAESMDKLNTYIAEHAVEMRNKHEEAYKGKFVAFRTTLEVIG